MRASIRALVFAALALLLQDARLCAQWKNIAPKVVTEFVDNSRANPQYGAIHFKDGVLWAGWLDLWSSPDSGKTWQKNNFNPNGDIITDINFYDKYRGLVATLNSGVFLTRDSGAHWVRVLNQPQCLNVAFDGSPTVMHALTVGSIPSPRGQLWSSYNGGGFWNPSFPGGDFCQCFCIAKDGSIYVLCSINNGITGFVSKSTDQGRTWNQSPTKIEGDSYTISADSCAQKNLYIANENYVASISVVDSSHLYASSDAGNSWAGTASFPAPYLSGAMTTTLHAIYSTSLSSGIYRSLDSGKTWKNIGGGSDSIPSAFDTRNITCASDNIVFVLDSEGSVWKTINSGGDSIITPPDIIVLSRDTLFAGDSLSLCDNAQSQFISFARIGCPLPTISSMKILGSGAANYTSIPAVSDSFGVTFKPSAIGAADAQLILQLSDGTSETVFLKGTVVNLPYTLSFTPDTLFKLDSAFTCDSVTGKQITIKTTGCPHPRVNGKAIGGSDASSFELISAPDTLTGSDNVIVTFKPITTGKLNANIVLTLNDGTTLTLPVTGYGLPSIPLKLTTLDQKSDTLGGTVQVPITISGLQKPEPVSLVVHYDTLLKYIGSFSLSNKPLDIANQQWKGRSEILIPNANPSGISAYAVFDVFDDTLPQQKVWFDSVSVTAIPPCRYTTASLITAVSVVNALTGCGTKTLSQFIHYGIMPQFALKPNPSGGDVSLTSSEDLGATEIIIYDMLGAEKGRSNTELKKDIPVRIELPLANGMYDMRLRTLSGVFDERVVVNR